MASMLNELTELFTLGGDELTYIVLNGKDYCFRVKNLSSLVGIPTKEQIGLGNVDNTSDANKPLSIAVIAALTQKAEIVHYHQISEVSGLADELLNLRSTTSGLSMSVSTLQTAFSGLAATVSANNQVVAALQNTVDTVNGQVQSLSTQVSSLSSNVTSMNGKVTSLTSSVQTISDQQASMASTLSTNTIDISNIKTTLSALQLDFQNTVATVNAFTTTVNNAVTRVAQAEAKVASLETSMQQSFNTLDARLTQDETNITNLGDQLNTASIRIDNNDEAIRVLNEIVSQDIATTVTFAQDSDW